MTGRPYWATCPLQMMSCSDGHDAHALDFPGRFDAHRAGPHKFAPPWILFNHGNPVENRYIESFNDRRRNECLNVSRFCSLEEPILSPDSTDQHCAAEEPPWP